jgi:hypothetical protein
MSAANAGDPPKAAIAAIAIKLFLMAHPTKATSQPGREDSAIERKVLWLFRHN